MNENLVPELLHGRRDVVVSKGFFHYGVHEFGGSLFDEVDEEGAAVAEERKEVGQSQISPFLGFGGVHGAAEFAEASVGRKKINRPALHSEGPRLFAPFVAHGIQN